MTQQHAIKIKAQDRISFKLMMRCVLVAFVLGIFLSVVQILLDYREQDDAIDSEINSLLNMIHLSASEAAYNIDERHAETLLQGLAKHKAVLTASIALFPQDKLLASYKPESGTKAEESRWMRGLSDLIFSPKRQYEHILRIEHVNGDIGRLDLSIDTFSDGKRFLRRAEVVILSGIIRAVILSLALITIFYFVLTRPLSRLVEQLRSVNPASPNNSELVTPQGHNSDELGAWVSTTNQLLASIEENMEQRQEAEARATYLRQYDRLTDLPNRASFQALANESIQIASHNGQRLMIICCDLNNFKDINSQHGFFFGDKLLYEVARYLEKLPEQIGVARLFGDMFALLIHLNNTEPEQILKTLQNTISRPLDIDGETFKLTARLGGSVYPVHGGDASDLVGKAERALSKAKADAKEYQLYFDQLDSELIRRRHLHDELTQAIENNELCVVYHPQVDSRTGRTCGVEALARWQHPELGSISPDTFISIAEESDLIFKLGDSILNQACVFGAQLNQQGEQHITIAVNISAKQLREPSLVTQVKQALNHSGLPPKLLELELTETTLINDVALATSTLSALRDMGVSIAIDDFGTGHASLNYLKQLPVCKLKIEKSFVKDMVTCEDDQQIIQAIISLGHSLGHEIVAEGVETQNHVDMLIGYRCDKLQGYHFSAPVDERQLLTYFEQEQGLSVVTNAANDA